MAFFLYTYLSFDKNNKGDKMIDKYRITRINNEEVMFVYLSLNYDFSMQDFNQKKDDLIKYLKEYLKKNHITFKGNVVNVMVGGFLVGSILLNNYQTKSHNYSIINEQKYVGNEVIKKGTDTSVIQKVIDLEKEKQKEAQEKEKEVVNNTKNTSVKKSTTSQSTKSNVSKKTNTSTTKTKNSTKTNSTTTKTNNNKSNNSNQKAVDNNIYINLKRGGKVEKIELEEYIIGVVGAEMPAAFHIEALKAQAIISRTYALKARSKEKTLSDNESTQSYKSNDELKKLWGANYNTYYNKIKSAVTKTKGMYLTYKGNYIEAVYHSTSNGKTESSVNVWGNSYPYLVSVESKYDNLNSSFTKTKKISYEELSKKLGLTITGETIFNIISKTSGNRVNQITIGDKTFTGVKLRNLLGLRSADFSILKEDDGVVFTTKGYGHGVGLSQYGANGYAKNGLNYKQILLHYYPGVSLKNR